ncbi:hypothetical protein [Crocosphaera sp.]|uniref:hypothetical protein n=2 Tax=Crocosphaera TaxID=263510 RepID=UPI00257DC3D2|nr:hypothetical protein [Crocosphaera sp.]NQZ61230.1 hypothetical protein [Crocosphaera sp.]
MLEQQTRDDLRLLIQGLKNLVLKEFFKEIKTLLDIQGFPAEDSLNALLDVFYENGIKENLLSDLEQEIERVTSVKDEQV